jgi:dienelactone hydrolase
MAFLAAFWTLGPDVAVGIAHDHKLRVIIETDAGGDPDDEQSLVRFLLYTNEWDVEGIIANRPHTNRPENKNPENSGLGIVRRLVKAYGECYPNLVLHDSRYPKPDVLLARTVAGYDDTEDAVKLIIAALDRNDPRPIWYADWGTEGAAVNNLKRALDRVLKERGPKGYAAAKEKLRVLCHANPFGDHTTKLEPPFPLLVDTFRPALDGNRWYHRFSALTATAGGFDLKRDVLLDHGPLGALYPTNTTHPQKEGDSMTFLYLVPNGLSDPEHPGWGCWAGRYGRNPEFGDRPCYWANQTDTWQSTTNRDNTVLRWAADLQNDFRTRLDWCVKHANEANHPPKVVVNGIEGSDVIHLMPVIGTDLKLDASGTSDPDGDRLMNARFVYPEAGTYGGRARIEESETSTATVHIPADATDKEIHIILAVTDLGRPPLTRYRRVVISPRDPRAAKRTIAPYFQPPAEYKNKLGSYRSPLLFIDGNQVRSAAEWPRRRKEILDTWQELMGSWPAVLEKPKVEVLAQSRRDNFTQYRVRLEIAPRQTGEGWLMIPEGPERKPAVLVVYYEPETSAGFNPSQPQRDFALQLAQRGFVTLSIGTPGGDARRPELGEAHCQPLSFHAYVAANCWNALANRPEVDAKRIGVVGHSYGGKWAMFAAALWDKFAAVAVSDPGIVFDETRPNVNYWEPWYLGFDPKQPRPKAGLVTRDNPRTGAYKKMMEAGRDLHELHALIAPRPFLVSGGSEDPSSRWLALNHTLAVNQLLGQTDRVAMTNRPGHTPTAESNSVLFAFFEHFLGNAQAFKTPEPVK